MLGLRLKGGRKEREGREGRRLERGEWVIWEGNRGRAMVGNVGRKEWEGVMEGRGRKKEKALDGRGKEEEKEAEMTDTLGPRPISPDFDTRLKEFDVWSL